MVAAANKAKSEWTLLDKIKSLNEWIDIIMLPYDFSLKGDPAEKATNNGWNDALHLIKQELNDIIDNYEPPKIFEIKLTDSTSIVCNNLRFTNREKGVIVTGINDMDTDAIAKQVDKGFKSLVVDNIWELFTDGKSQGSIVLSNIKDIVNTLIRAIKEVE